jgi:triacylglycerol lipase
VVSIEYRLAPQHKFPAQIDDCRTALLWIRENAKRFRIDPTRIAGFGYSAGGHLVCLLGLLNSDDENERLQAVVAGGAPCEFRTLPETSGLLTYWLGGTRSELPEAYRDASPTTFASADDPPVFFYHGQRDRMVPNRSAKGLHQLLKDKGVRTDMYTVVDAGHIKTFFDQKSVDRAAQFLDDVLKPSQPE